MTFLLSKTINYYAKYIGYFLNFILPVVLIGVMSIEGISPENIIKSSYNIEIQALWFIFIINSFLLAVNGVVTSLSFESEVKRLIKEGTPIESASGFRKLEKKYKASNMIILVIFILAIISWLFFYLATAAKTSFANFVNHILPEDHLATLNLYLSLSAILFTIAASIAIRIPSLTDMRSGSLLKFYDASRHTIILQSYLSDAIYTLLDPITRVDFLKWSDKITSRLNDDFAPNLNPSKNRPTLAVQNIITILYMHYRFPDLIPYELLLQELERIVPLEVVNEIIEENDLNLIVWKRIFKHLIKENADIFYIIDRIVLTLKQTPELMNSKPYWFTSAVPPTQKKDADQDIVFFVWNRNKNETIKPVITLKFTGADDLSPHDFELEFPINPYDDFITIPEGYSYYEKKDTRFLIKLVTGILYQGTGIWISVHSENIGSNLIAVEFYEKNQPIESQIFNMRVVVDSHYLIERWGPKILASLGLLLPIIKAILGL